MDTLRKPFQGLSNIMLFNWHFYLIAFVLILSGVFLSTYLDSKYQLVLIILILLASLSILISIAVSYYIYDISDLYKMPWIEINDKDKRIINIHAGFDETSLLLENIFDQSELIIFDFYDPEKHTEVSIQRARKKYPNDPRTKVMKTDTLHLDDNSVDKVFVLLAAHEIRNEEERIIFFKELKRVLNVGGKIYIMEHLRDIPNFIAFNIGFFHFHSLSTWRRTFSNAGLSIEKQIKCTPFISTFILN